MPFHRLSAMVRGAVDVGGTAKTVDLGVVFGGGDPQPEPTQGQSDLVIVYRTQRDSRVRPAHAALEGRTWAIDDPRAPAPPLGYGCRCHTDIVKRSELAKPPTTEVAALKKFPELDENVEQYMGKEIAALYRAGDLKAKDLLTETGDPINLAQARVIAAARQAERSPTPGLTALAELNGMGLNDATVRAIAQKAQALIDNGAKPDDALRVTLSTSPRIALLRSRVPAVAVKRNALAIERLKATGLLRYDQPELPPPTPKAPTPREPTEAAAKVASAADQVTDAVVGLIASYRILAAHYRTLAKHAANAEQAAAFLKKAKEAEALADALGPESVTSG